MNKKTMPHNLLFHYAQRIFIIGFFFSMGILFYTMYHQKLLIFWCSAQPSSSRIERAERKPFYLHFYKNGQWHTEDKDLIKSANIHKTVLYLVTAWLNILEEEQVTEKPVELKTVLLDDQNKEVFLSFDRNPFLKASSIKQKLIWVEGLLKTIQANIPGIQSVRLLVHHKIMADPHLDFSASWPVTDFLTAEHKTHNNTSSL